MLRKLMAILGMGLGAQFLLPPIFVVPVSTDNLLGQPMQAAIAAELSDIRDRGYIIVGIKNNRPPLGFIDTDGNLAGFEVDIARRLASDIFGVENAVQFVPLSNVDRLNAVLDERVDIAISDITLSGTELSFSFVFQNGPTVMISGTVDRAIFQGMADAGGFGSFPMTATRQSE